MPGIPLIGGNNNPFNLSAPLLRMFTQLRPTYNQHVPRDQRLQVIRLLQRIQTAYTTANGQLNNEDLQNSITALTDHLTQVENRAPLAARPHIRAFREFLTNNRQNRAFLGTALNGLILALRANEATQGGLGGLLGDLFTPAPTPPD